MNQPYAVLDEKPFDSHYLWEEVEIDAPVATVFALARDIGSWMDGHGLEPVSGRPGEVGFLERVFIRRLAPGTPEPHHHIYGIAHMIPNRYIALEVMPERGGSYGNPRDWVSFDGIHLNELDERTTRVAFHMIDEHRGRGTAEWFAARTAEMEQMRRELIIPYLATLKARAEAEVAGP